MFASIDCMDCGLYSKNGSGCEQNLLLDKFHFKILFIFIVYGFVYSRLPYPSCKSVESQLQSLTACGIPLDAWVDVKHDNCTEIC